MDDIEQTFLDAIIANPDDAEARSVYADWLDERGDPRGEYLRIEAQLNAGPARVAELTATLDPAWLAKVTRKCDVVILEPGRKIDAIKAVREVTGLSLKQAKDFVESPMPRSVRIELSFEEAQAVVAAFKSSTARVIVLPCTAPLSRLAPPSIEEGLSTLVITSINNRSEAISAVHAVIGIDLPAASELVDLVRSGAQRILLVGATSDTISAAVRALRPSCDIAISS